MTSSNDEVPPIILVASQRAAACSYCRLPTYWRLAMVSNRDGGVIAASIPRKATAVCVACAKQNGGYLDQP